MILNHYNILVNLEIVKFDNVIAILKNRIIAYAKNYNNLLTENEYKTLTQKTYKVSNFYMLPKFHKSKELNDIIMAKNSKYINVDKILTIEGRPIVEDPVTILVLFHKFYMLLWNQLFLLLNIF